MADQTSGLLSPLLRYLRIKQALPFISGKVLDFGCGVGELARYIAPEYYVGVDKDLLSIQKAKQKFPDHTFMLSLPTSESFDTIVALAVIEHLENPILTLSMLTSFLSENGQIVVTTPHPSFEFLHTVGAIIKLCSKEANEEHKMLFDRKKLENIAEKNGLFIFYYKRFLLRMNQLFVLRKKQL